jgi:hypothetical protein
MRRLLAILIGLYLTLHGTSLLASDPSSIFWSLDGDIGSLINHGADLTASGRKPGTKAALLDGRGSYLEVPARDAVDPGAKDFTISLWAHTEKMLDDGLGDLIAKFDPDSRTGFHLGVMNYSGVTTHQSNYRQLQFGIDAGTEPVWKDVGKPGNAVYVMALAEFAGDLYAGTFEIEADQRGHVYRYVGGTDWEDCGSPDPCNAVSALAVFDGQLYAGVARYKSSGSALKDAANQAPGGRIYRYEGGKQWTDCGKLGEADAVMGLAVYQGKLFAIPLYHQGTYVYEGGTTWKSCGTPGVRLMSLAVFDGHLYAAGNEGKGDGGVYRYEGGETWTRAGGQAGVTQVYSFAVYGSQLYAGTWPNAAVFRYAPPSWIDVGRMGQELEVMGMMAFNGKLYGGTLPLAEVYRYDGDNQWTNTGRLDPTPDVKYRRAWSMAVHDGKLFCGTLPSGHVHALQTGACVTSGAELPAGWVHIAAVRDKNRLRLHIDGKEVATAIIPAGEKFDLSTDASLTLGRGPHDSWNGKLAEVRLDTRALAPDDIAKLAQP